jgi:TonB family protein
MATIVPPKLIHTLPMRDNGNQHVHVEGRARTILVDLTVNQNGEPTDLRIPQPADDALDVEVLATVGKFRYQPGTLDGKPIPMSVHMHYVVPVGTIY